MSYINYFNRLHIPMSKRLIITGSILGVYCNPIALRNAVIFGTVSYGGGRCLAYSDGGSKSNSDEFLKWLKNFAERRDSTNSKPFVSEELLDNFSNQVNRVMESGVVGKVGYGFMMGYASGLCIKKVIHNILF